MTENASNLFDYTDPKNWKVEKFVGYKKETGKSNIKNTDGYMIKIRWIGFLEIDDTMEPMKGVYCELNKVKILQYIVNSNDATLLKAGMDLGLIRI